MKKNSIRIIAVMVITLMLCALSACMMPYGSQSSTTPDPSEVGEIQDIVISTYSTSIQVNMETAIAGVGYADSATEFIEDIEYSVSAFDADGNELSADMYEHRIENGIIIIKAKEIGSIVINAVSKYDKTAEVTIPVTRQSLTPWDIIILGIGIYALGAGILGKGKVYAADFVKEGMENKHRKTVRITCITVSICMIASSIIAAIDSYGEYDIIVNILFCVGAAIFIASYFFTNSMIDKSAKKEAEEKRMQGRDLKAPSSAFEFDEDEPTVDNLKK